MQNFLDLRFSNLSFWLKDPGISYNDSFVHVHRVHLISCTCLVRLEVVFMVIEKPKRLCILEVWSLTCADNDLHVPERPADLTYLPELRVNPCCFQSKPWTGVVKEECVWSREHPEELEEG